jgi:hypothetical protein
VNFTPGEIGNGVYFLNCCAYMNNAHYKFAGSPVGDIFNVNQGQISFYLKSRYSFAQRQTTASAPRFAFDVRDGQINNHLFYFLTLTSGGSLMFAYTAAGSTNFYVVPQGTEDALFGNDVLLKVTIQWDGAATRLYLNDILVNSAPYALPTPNWTAASTFDLGAYEFLTSRGFYTSDDVIDEFTVARLPRN